MTDERIARFTSMKDSRPEDWILVLRAEANYRAGMADRMLDLLSRCDTVSFAHQVTSFQHGLQTASRARRDGADDETVVVALLHDLGEVINPDNHAEVTAALLRPWISEENYWLVRHHAIFQGSYYYHHLGGDRDARERYRGHPAFDRTADFCERWDQCSFDPGYDSLPLSDFEPLVRRLFAREPRQCP
jgi:predicted HD phosphohydrolase